ncbi:MAG: sigma-70 family RNA polymerase sigma factor [Planctomycetota bacterium]
MAGREMAVPESDKEALREISTRWSCVQDPNRFTLRYISAMKHLLLVIMKDEDAATDVLQRFLLKVIERGIQKEVQAGGRFRDYLAKSLRNAAIDFYRSKAPSQASELLLQGLEDKTPSHDEVWRESWTSCLLDRAWQKLERYEYTTQDCIYHRVLKLSSENPQRTSSELAERLAQVVFRPVTAESFRQQLSRARRKFAEFLHVEVQQTLEAPTEDELQHEIASLGLKKYFDRFDLSQ